MIKAIDYTKWWFRYYIGWCIWHRFKVWIDRFIRPNEIRDGDWVQIMNLGQYQNWSLPNGISVKDVCAMKFKVTGSHYPEYNLFRLVGWYGNDLFHSYQVRKV